MTLKCNDKKKVMAKATQNERGYVGKVGNQQYQCLWSVGKPQHLENGKHECSELWTNC